MAHMDMKIMVSYRYPQIFPTKRPVLLVHFPQEPLFLQLNFHPWPGRAEKAARGEPTEAANIFTAMANGLLIWQI
jgi:hypothetical protein